MEVVEEELEEHPIADPEVADGIPRVDKRRIANDARTAILGENPRAKREMIRSSLPEGFCLVSTLCARCTIWVHVICCLTWITHGTPMLEQLCRSNRSSTWCARSVRGRASTRPMSLASRRFPHPRQRASRSDDGHWAGRVTLVTNMAIGPTE